MKTINLSNTDAEGEFKTSIKIDNSTNYKDFVVSQGTTTKCDELHIQIDREGESITINNIVFSGINRLALLQFLNQ